MRILLIRNGVGTQTSDADKSKLSPEMAVLLGHLVVNLPVFSIMGLACLLGYALRGQGWAIIGLLLGVIPAWLWWSISVPRWREWAKQQGADEERTQFLGQRSGLVWPKGSIFEKTEFRPRKRKQRS
jgi:uncharacterized membrane protein